MGEIGAPRQPASSAQYFTRRGEISGDWEPIAVDLSKINDALCSKAITGTQSIEDLVADLEAARSSIDQGVDKIASQQL